MGTPSTRELQESLDRAFELVDQEATSADGEAPAQEAEPSEQSGQDEAAAAVERRDGRAADAGLPMMLGFALMVAGLALAAGPLAGILPRPVADQLVGMGLSPALLFLAGALMAVLSWSQALGRRASKETLLDRLETGLQALEAQVEAIGAEARAARAAGTEEERLFEVQRLLGKQDGVISNLTKAVRMHNKPLVDLVGTTTDLAKRIEESDKHTLAIKLDLEHIEKAITESVASSEKRWEGMFERLRGSEQELDARQAKNRDLLLERLEPHVTNECKRLAGELETQWDLVRETLERAIKQMEMHTREEVQAVGRRFDEIARVTTKIDELSRKLQELERAPAVGLSADEQRQIAGMQRTAQQILAAVERLEGRANAAPAPMPMHQPGPAHAAPRPAPAATPAASSTAPDGDGSARNERTGKVLSAIERLKQMRGP